MTIIGIIMMDTINGLACIPDTTETRQQKLQRPLKPRLLKPRLLKLKLLKRRPLLPQPLPLATELRSLLIITIIITTTKMSGIITTMDEIMNADASVHNHRVNRVLHQL